MNTKKRFLFGLVSSLFLVVGLVRAADRFDPGSRTGLKFSEDVRLNAPGSNSNEDCWADLGES
ncbi:MAG: hypothetical protein ABIZ49_08250 [Opitutaceae bacterium]